MQADGHGIYTVPRRLPEEVPTITEAFGENGYEVFACPAHRMTSAALDYMQGVSASKIFERTLTASDPAFVALLDSLRHDKHRRAAVVATFSVTHGPYQGYDLDGFCRKYPVRCELRHDQVKFERYRRMYYGGKRSTARFLVRTPAHVGCSSI